MRLRDHVKARESEKSKQEASPEASQPTTTALGKVAEFAKEKAQEIYEDVAPVVMAYGRMGASEAAIALKAFPESIGPQETTGTIGNPTQQQISQEFGVYGRHTSADRVVDAEQTSGLEAADTSPKDGAVAVAEVTNEADKEFDYEP